MMIMDTSSLIEAIEGPRLSVPIALVEKLGDIASAAFLAQAAYLTARSKEKDGWFDLPQVGPPSPDSQFLWGKLGSWQSILGIGVDAQNAVRVRLKAFNLLEEKRSGIPCKLYYRVRSDVYLAFLAQKSLKQPVPVQSDSSRIKMSENPESRLRRKREQDTDRSARWLNGKPESGFG